MNTTSLGISNEFVILCCAVSAVRYVLAIDVASENHSGEFRTLKCPELFILGDC